MAQIYYALLTKIGQSKVANAVALGRTVRWNSMAVGDGNGSITHPNEDQTDLVHETYRAPLNQLTIDSDNANYMVAEMVVPTNVGGWYVHEVGIYDEEGHLVVVANFPGTYKPKLSDGSGSDLVIRLLVQVSNTSAVTLKIDPAITLASQKWSGDNFVRKTVITQGEVGQVLTKQTSADLDVAWAFPKDLVEYATEATQGLVQLATAEQAQAQMDEHRVLTPKTLSESFKGGNAKLADTGYQRFPSGLILQWGLSVAGQNGDSVVVFPITFPNGVFRAIVAEGAARSWAATTAMIYGAFDLTRSGMKVKCRSIQGAAGPIAASGGYSHWLAIGN